VPAASALPDIVQTVEKAQARRVRHRTALLYQVPLLFVTINPVDPPDLVTCLPLPALLDEEETKSNSLPEPA